MDITRTAAARLVAEAGDYSSWAGSSPAAQALHAGRDLEGGMDRLIEFQAAVEAALAAAIDEDQAEAILGGDPEAAIIAVDNAWGRVDVDVIAARYAPGA